MSKVDLLSSGVGFVISSNDLEDCINYLNKELYSFAEKEFRARMDTTAFIFDQLKSKILSQEKVIEAQEKKIRELEESFKEKLEAQVLAKSSQALFEMESLQKQFTDFKQFTQGLEDKVRSAVKKDINLEVQQLVREKDQLRAHFLEFKNEIIVLCKSEIRNNEHHIIRFVNQKTNEALNQLGSVE